MTEAKNIILPVTGMTCANCSATIERNVRKIPGVEIANVNLASEKLTRNIRSNPARRTRHHRPRRADRLRHCHWQDRITDHRSERQLGCRHAGEAARQTKRCAGSRVSYGTERATLEYIPGMTSIAELAAVIRKAGFDLVQVGEAELIEDVEATGARQRSRAPKTLADHRA